VEVATGTNQLLGDGGGLVVAPNYFIAGLEAGKAVVGVDDAAVPCAGGQDLRAADLAPSFCNSVGDRDRDNGGFGEGVSGEKYPERSHS